MAKYLINWITVCDIYAFLVKDQLLKYQHPFSGLFPRRPEALAHDCVAHVRDNVYCATAIWALHRSFQHVYFNNVQQLFLG